MMIFGQCTTSSRSSFWLAFPILLFLDLTSEILVYAFECNDGCDIGDYANDTFCDCAECEDESEWNCDTCFQGCPTSCGMYNRCIPGNEYFGLSFECTAQDECDSDIFYCVDSGTGEDTPICNITCSGIQSCYDSIVVVANTGGVQLNCPGENSCSYMQVTWVNSDNVDMYKAVDSNAAVGGPLHKIDCHNSMSSCIHLDVAGDTQQLGLDTVTQWNCAEQYSCTNSLAVIRGSVLVDCTGANSCDNFDLRCMSGANCETVAINAVAANGATMTCDSGVQSCVCSEFFDCLQLTAEPMTSTAEVSTTMADPSTTTTETETTTAKPITSTAKASTTTTDPSTTTVDPITTTLAETTTSEALATSTTPDASSTSTREATTDEPVTTTAQSTTNVRSTTTRQSSIESTTHKPANGTKAVSNTTETAISTTKATVAGNGGGDKGLSVAVLALAIGCGVGLCVGLCLGAVYLGRDYFRKDTDPMKFTDGNAQMADGRSVASAQFEASNVQMTEEMAVEGLVTGGRDDSEESGERKEALRKVGKMQRDEKDAVFGQMLGDLKLGNALLEADVVGDMGVVGETLGYDAEEGEVQFVDWEAAGCVVLDKEAEVVVEGADDEHRGEDGGHHTGALH